MHKFQIVTRITGSTIFPDRRSVIMAPNRASAVATAIASHRSAVIDDHGIGSIDHTTTILVASCREIAGVAA